MTGSLHEAPAGVLYRKRFEDGTYLAGMAAYYDPPLRPELLRRRAGRLAYEGWSTVDNEPRHAERQLRQAIEALVDAFLLDRRGNADCFARAHRMGAWVEQRFGCRWRLEGDQEIQENACGILALHSRMAFSAGGRSWGYCSVCGARDFMCDHLPGQTYGGVHCHRVIDRWEVDEVSATIRPRDARCFRVWSPLALGVAGTKPLRCRHCASCVGSGGPTDQDLDPPSWPEDADSLIDRTMAVSRGAAAVPP